jgi:hypothetical protein
MLIPLGFLGGLVKGDFELISTTVLAATATSVTLTLPAGTSTTYKHLQLRYLGQTASGGPDVQLRFNGDSGANYSWHIVYGNGTSAGTASATSTNQIGFGNASSGANAFGGAIIDILDAFNTSKNKTTRSLYGSQGNLTVGLWSGAWYSTSAISTITILNSSAVNFTVGSRFSLYGVRG